MTWNAAAQSALINGQAISRRWLLWIEAKNRSTNAVETMGIWDGGDNQQFVLDGQTRDYIGAFGKFQVDALRVETGTGIRRTTITLPSLTPEVEQLIRGYSVRFAPCELHLALYDGETDALLDVKRRFKGFVDGAPTDVAALGGSSDTTLEIVSAARLGTNKPASKKSDERQKLRGGDRFRKYGDVSGVAGDWWGSRKPRSAVGAIQNTVGNALGRFNE